MNRADYLKLGSWNARCDRCGAKRKGDELQKTWNGLYVCPEHWEPRQAQDFIRSIQENPLPPFTRNPVGDFVGPCTPNGTTALPDVATADCAINDYISPMYDPDVTN